MHNSLGGRKGSPAMHSLALNENGKNAIREHSFGLASLPSDSINSLMHNDF